MMKVHRLESSSIAQVEETGRNTIIVQFRKGARYEYHGVPRETLQGLLDAPSAGRFFNENIRGQYDEERVT